MVFVHNTTQVEREFRATLLLTDTHIFILENKMIILWIVLLESESLQPI